MKISGDAESSFAALYSSKKDSIQSSQTAKLWLQYMDMITILRNFITAERLGD